MNLEALRKLIREEMRTVIREELKGILTEAVVIASTPETKSQVQNFNPHVKTESTYKPKFSEILAEKKAPVSTGNPMFDLLNETAMSMTSNEYRTMINADASMAPNFGMIGGVDGEETAAVGTVEQMLSSNRPTTDINQVTIDVVPDFTGLMNTLKSKGAI